MVKKLARWAAAGALVMAAAFGPATAAQAAPVGVDAAPPAGAVALNSVEAYLYTAGDLATANDTGNAGAAAGLWTSYRTQSGWAGYSLFVTYTPTTTPRANYVPVLTDNASTCDFAGDMGQQEQIWVYYYCQVGIAGYTLYVR